MMTAATSPHVGSNIADGILGLRSRGLATSYPKERADREIGPFFSRGLDAQAFSPIG